MQTMMAMPTTPGGDDDDDDAPGRLSLSQMLSYHEV